MQNEIALLCEKTKILQDEVIPYGFNKAKIDLKLLKRLKDEPNGKLILVTAINPTPAGEGKTTVSIGLSQGLKKIGKNVITALREPSLGPVFGLKGGATGGGKSSIVPSDEINLHFTGDLHAITAANNLLSALVDAHIFHGNELDIQEVVWPRVMDMNDRNLRSIETASRKDGFIITAASEVMAVLALASDLANLKERLNRILIGYNSKQEPIFVKDLGAADAMTVLLKDAMNPNLVRSLEGVLTFVHAGPFANIAHGCNSVVATKMALKLADYVVTEAGFGADLGMEKFLDLKVPHINKQVDAVVIVTTLRALKSHGGAKDYQKPDLKALEKGVEHIEKHISNIKGFGLPFVIAVNHFYQDPQEETKFLLNWAKEKNHPIELARGFAEGGEGMVDLAKRVVHVIDSTESKFIPIYNQTDLPREKITKIATKIYGAKEVQFSKKAERQLELYETLGWNLPVCMAKTPASLSGDPSLIGVPKDFILSIQEIKPSLGAGFLVALTKGIMVMPGLNKEPRALRMVIDDEGNLSEKEA
jgi:formate--tetrahydrofolate ligase